MQPLLRQYIYTNKYGFRNHVACYVTTSSTADKKRRRLPFFVPQAQFAASSFFGCDI